MKILGVSPHADDVELGLGGYIAAKAHEGAKVTIAVLTQTAGSRQKEALAGAKMLKVQDYRFLELGPENELGTTAHMGKNVQKLEVLFGGLQPDEIYIPLPSFHQDHRAAFEMCLSALRPNPNRYHPRRVLAYENPGQSWRAQDTPTTGYVYYRLNDDWMHDKLASLTKHVSQWVSKPDKNAVFSQEGVIRLAQFRGIECGAEYAERFYLIQEVM